MARRGLALVGAALLVVGVAVVATGRARPEPPVERAPRWQRTQVEALEALGYVAGEEPATAVSGVTLHDRARAWPGTNLVVSGHDWEAVLLDMDGAVLHRWTMPTEARGDHPHPRFRRAFLLDDGDLLAITEGHSLVRLDRASRLRWQALDHDHHDLHVDADGTILALTREARVVKGLGRRPVLDDAITRYGADGKKLGSLSILDALLRSDAAELVALAKARGRDPLHTNSVEVLDGRAAHRHPAFANGNLLLSSRSLSALLVIDPATRKVVWWHRGGHLAQHDAKIVDDGLLLLFDNRPADPPSAVRLLDPADGRVVWEHRPTEAGAAFFSKTCGTVEKLPNGNLLVVASNPGLAFEITSDGERVWQLHNPYRAGAQQELVANLYDVVRAPPVAELKWLRAGEGP